MLDNRVGHRGHPNLCAAEPRRYGRRRRIKRFQEDESMELSARNQLRGTVKSVTLGNVMAEVIVDVGGQEIASAITRGSAERLGLSETTRL
jgi:molybdopterin-binding protein